MCRSTWGRSTAISTRSATSYPASATPATASSAPAENPLLPEDGGEGSKNPWAKAVAGPAAASHNGGDQNDCRRPRTQRNLKAMLRFQLSNKREHQQFEHGEGPIELGRGPKRNNVARCTIQDLYVSKDHVRIEERPRGLIRIENLSQRNPIWFPDSSKLDPNAVRQ